MPPYLFVVFASTKAVVKVLATMLFQHLAHYASENLEAMNPPLFLRFLNLLMNDAIFLLDEAIQVIVISFKLISDTEELTRL